MRPETIGLSMEALKEPQGLGQGLPWSEGSVGCKNDAVIWGCLLLGMLVNDYNPELCLRSIGLDSHGGGWGGGGGDSAQQGSLGMGYCQEPGDLPLRLGFIHRDLGDSQQDLLFSRLQGPHLHSEGAGFSKIH